MNNNIEYNKMCVKFWEVIWKKHSDSECNLVGIDENGIKVSINKGPMLSKDDIKSLLRVDIRENNRMNQEFKTYKLMNNLNYLSDSEDTWLIFLMGIRYSKSWNGENWIEK